jgi:hypothetical protein
VSLAPQGDVLCSSWLGLPLYRVDFGAGTPFLVDVGRSLGGGVPLLPNWVTMLPSAAGHQGARGGAQVYATLTKDQVRRARAAAESRPRAVREPLESR